MNIREYIKAGGPGSGCHGDNCGRPPGHGGGHKPADKLTWIEKRADEKLRQKLFKQERRRLGFRESKKDYPTGLTPEALRKMQEKESEKHGTMTRQEKRELAKTPGQVFDMQRKGLVLKTDVTRVVDRKIERVKIGRRVYKVEVETVKPVGGPSTPSMGKQRGRNVPEGPPGKAHSLYGKFKEVMSFNKDDRQFRAFEAESGRAPGHGASLFLNKETVGNKSRVSIQEVRREEHAHISETRTFHFDSGKVAKDYLRQRYGIKDVKWRG